MIGRIVFLPEASADVAAAYACRKSGVAASASPREMRGVNKERRA